MKKCRQQRQVERNLVERGEDLPRVGVLEEGRPLGGSIMDRLKR